MDLTNQKKIKTIKRAERKPDRKSTLERLDKIYRMAQALANQASELQKELKNGNLG